MPASKKKKVEKQEFGLAIPNLPGYFLIFAVIASLIGLYITLERFIVVLVIAAIITIAFYPVYKWILNYVKRDWLAAMISLILVVVIIVLPITLLILLLSREAFDTYVLIEREVAAGALDPFLDWDQNGFLFELKDKLRPILDLDSLDIKNTITSVAQSVSGFLVTYAATFVKQLTTLLIDFVVMLFVMFYFFVDAKKIKETLILYSPLPTKYEKKIFKKLDDMVSAIIYGMFLTATIQGILGGIGFWMAGISNAIFWGSLIAFFALIPLVGTGVVWAPAGLILIFTGNIAWGVFLLLWGAFVVGLVDNLVRPYLVSGRAHTYPLLTFLSIFGGIFAFGLKGILFGPVIMMLAVTFLYIYSLEYKRILKD